MTSISNDQMDPLSSVLNMKFRLQFFPIDRFPPMLAKGLQLTDGLFLLPARIDDFVMAPSMVNSRNMREGKSCVLVLSQCP